jgi:hypothetical protein
MTQKGKPIKFYILFFLGMFAVIYLLKYAANSRDLTAEHFAGGFLQTLSIFTVMTYSYYLSDRRSILTKEEFKAIQKKSTLIIFLFIWTTTSGVSIIEKILLHAEVKWVKFIASGFGWAIFIILFAIIMTKIVPVKITSKSTPNLRQ